ncbi:unnamed protein product [Ixodes hexagonus]
MSKHASGTERDSRNDYRELRAEMRTLKESMDFINAEFEDMKKKLEEARGERDALKKENADLREKCKENECAIEQLQMRVVQCEQYSRRSNIEIRGLVENENENVTELVSKIGEVIGEPIAADDVEACHRVPTRQAGKSNVVVQFKSRQKRDTVLEKARKSRIRNHHVGISDEAQVYLNEHLCPTLKRLLSLAIAKKRECQWRFVWTRNGKIFARKTEQSAVQHILSEADLCKIA